MFKVPTRVRPHGKGVVATARIAAGSTVWGLTEPSDRVFSLDELKRFSAFMFFVFQQLGFRSPYSRLWVLPSDALSFIKKSTHFRAPNLRYEMDRLIAIKDIPADSELVAPAEMDLDVVWKRRVPQGSTVAEPSLKLYLNYVRRVG